MQVVVVIPAHNEVDRLPHCLRSVLAAAERVGVPVWTVVVLDTCDDGSEHLAGQFGDGVDFICIDAKNVGTARATGFSFASRRRPGDPRNTWFACTDADTCVEPDWLQRQLAAAADMVLGVVQVPEGGAPAALERSYLRGLDTHGNGHEHVHGANLGCRAAPYWAVGGFADLQSGEDADLVDRFEAAGYRIERDQTLSVTTSARRVGRAPGGFAEDLRAGESLAVEDAS